MLDESAEDSNDPYIHVKLPLGEIFENEDMEKDSMVPESINPYEAPQLLSFG